MDLLMVLLGLSQQPRRVVPGEAAAVTPIYRQVKTGEERVEGLLQRVECPPGRPVTFVMKLKDRVVKYQAPRLDAVEYIAHTTDFKGPMSCGGRMAGRSRLSDLEDRRNRAPRRRGRVPSAEVVRQSGARSGGGAEAWKSV